MNILVTGSEGYIGSNLCPILSASGATVTQCDSELGVGAEDWTLFEDIDFIVHLAAVSGIKDCERDRDKATTSNILSLANICFHAKEMGIPVLFTSSGAAKSPSSSYYATTKDIGEKIVQRANPQNRILRLTNVYGGSGYVQSKSSVIAQFIRAKLNGERFRVSGDGCQTRDFVHVYDVCKVIQLLIEKKNLKISGPIDVGTGVGTSINQLCKLFNKEPIYTRDNPGVLASVANTSKLESIGFVPQNRVEKYLKSLNLF